MTDKISLYNRKSRKQNGLELFQQLERLIGKDGISKEAAKDILEAARISKIKDMFQNPIKASVEIARETIIHLYYYLEKLQGQFDVESINNSRKIVKSICSNINIEFGGKQGKSAEEIYRLLSSENKTVRRNEYIRLLRKFSRLVLPIAKAFKSHEHINIVYIKKGKRMCEFFDRVDYEHLCWGEIHVKSSSNDDIVKINKIKIMPNC